MALVENRRSEWAETELLEFLRICNEQTKDPLSIRGYGLGPSGYLSLFPHPTEDMLLTATARSDDLFNPSDSIASVRQTI